ncbi:hypothetical protein BDQ12DRAFT_739501 [Crucibulum laeve]|uniref:BTB domain-containing protein n=1 Tax=Crucibulum laeve TaxID=68775 RepID=A0A5C3LK52_9AGAR|nr:hypothetical protein BDQ12DRAFT_739501 [Crucibulum laeve]
MFQVASHPTSFAMHGHGYQQSTHSSSSVSPTVQLPRTLQRPSFADVSRDAIITASPECADVPAEYLRRGLRARTSELLDGISSLSVSHIPSSMPRSHLPRSLTIPLHPSSSHSSSLPTHILAISSSRGPASPADQLRFYPVHSIVIAAQCASFPRISAPTHQSLRATRIELPVVEVKLPSPAAFSLIHSYLYNHRLDKVLKSLYPMPSSFLQTASHQSIRTTLGSGTALHTLSMYLCTSASSNLQTLMTHAAHIKELWQDMAALGIHEPELWDTLDLAWEVLLGALNLAAGGH